MKKTIILLFVGCLLSLTDLLAQENFENCFALKRIRAKAGGASAYEAVEIAETICYRKFYPDKKRMVASKKHALKENSDKDTIQETSKKENNNNWVVATQLRVHWELQDVKTLVSDTRSAKKIITNEETPIAKITGNSDNLNLRFAGKNSDLILNYSKDGKQKIITSTSREIGKWSLGGSLTIDKDSANSNANISDFGKIHLKHRSGLRLNFNRTNVLKDVNGSSSVNSGEIGFTTKNKKYNSTLDGSLLFNDGFSTRIQMYQSF